MRLDILSLTSFEPGANGRIRTSDQTPQVFTIRVSLDLLSYIGIIYLVLDPTDYLSHLFQTFVSFHLYSLYECLVYTCYTLNNHYRNLIYNS